MSNFQIAILVTFIVFLALGILIFSGFLPISRSSPTGASGQVILWGTARTQDMNPIVQAMNKSGQGFTISYVEKNAATFDHDLIQALASGTGPDLFFLSNDLVLKYKDKIIPIPFANFPERTYKDTYVGAADVFLSATDGVLAQPLSIDPMVMYWNPSFFESAGIPKVPQYWDEFYALAPKLTQKDNAGNIVKSAIAFGEFDNVAYAKDILSTLIMQAGNSIVGIRDGVAASVIKESPFGAKLNPAEEAVRFYTEFSNPLKSDYSWNRSLLNSRDAFIAGDLAVYFGYASELFTIRERNPNLNFDVAMMPQIRNAQGKLTYGRVNAVAVSKGSKNITTAFVAENMLSSAAYSGVLSATRSLPSVRRDLISTKESNPYMVIFNNSALVTRSWLDPDTTATARIFKDVIDSVTSGAANANEAISKANDELDLLIRRL